MEHSIELTFESLEQQNKIHEDGTKRCAYIKILCCNGCMDLSYVRMRIVHRIVTIKDESCRAHINMGVISHFEMGY